MNFTFPKLTIAQYAKLVAALVSTLTIITLFVKAVVWVDGIRLAASRVEGIVKADSLHQVDFRNLADAVYKDDELLDSLRMQVALAAPVHDYLYFLHSLDRVNKRLDEVEEDIGRLRRGDRSGLRLDHPDTEGNREFTHTTGKE